MIVKPKKQFNGDTFKKALKLYGEKKYIYMSFNIEANIMINSKSSFTSTKIYRLNKILKWVNFMI